MVTISTICSQSVSDLRVSLSQDDLPTTIGLPTKYLETLTSNVNVNLSRETVAPPNIANIYPHLGFKAGFPVRGFAWHHPWP